jgi:hypothetical protein
MGNLVWTGRLVPDAVATLAELQKIVPVEARAKKFKQYRYLGKNMNKLKPGITYATIKEVLGRAVAQVVSSEPFMPVVNKVTYHLFVDASTGPERFRNPRIGFSSDN